jgi:hypothetical protein
MRMLESTSETMMMCHALKLEMHLPMATRWSWVKRYLLRANSYQKIK